MCISDFCQARILQHIARAHQWPPRLQGDSLLFAIGDRLFIHEIGMGFDLIDHGLDLSMLGKLFQMVFFKVRNANRPDSPRPIEIFQRLPAGEKLPGRPMQQINIHLTQFLFALLKGAQHRIISLYIIPNLRCEQDVIHHAHRIKGISNFSFIFIKRSGIKRTVSALIGLL